MEDDRTRMRFIECGYVDQPTFQVHDTEVETSVPIETHYAIFY